MKDAKRPIQDYSFHRLGEDLNVESGPYFEMEVIGHTMDAEDIDEDFPFWIQQFEDLLDMLQFRLLGTEPAPTVESFVTGHPALAGLPVHVCYQGNSR